MNKNWKRALVLGSLGAGAVLLLAGKRPAALVAATIGLAVAASEYPDTLEKVLKHAPDYASRGIEILQTVSQIVERISEQAQHGLEEHVETFVN